MKNETVIYGINGPVVTVKAAQSFSMMEMVYVGKERLVGEVIGITERTSPPSRSMRKRRASVRVNLL